MKSEAPLKRPVPAGDILDVLYVGQCEPLKAGVHGVMLATVALCAVYNAAAWLKRRERHLGINAILYGAATLWEHRHVQQHLACRPRVPAAGPDEDPLRDVA
jgi:uncharacterized membrane protein (UPF0136 family)